MRHLIITSFLLTLSAPVLAQSIGVATQQLCTVSAGVVAFVPGATGVGPTLSAKGETNLNYNISGNGTGGVSVQGCVNFGKLSAAPAGAACNTYYDTDINLYCFHNGTSWLQFDDSSTGCS